MTQHIDVPETDSIDSDASSIDEFFDFHLEVLGRILVGDDLASVLEERARESERLNYREVAETVGLLSFDDEGGLRGAYPVSPSETPYRIKVDGVGSGYAMCAIDSLGAAYMFGRKTDIESVDPATDRPIQITIDPEDLDTSPYSHLRVTTPKAMPQKEEGVAVDPAADFCPLIGFVEGEKSIPEDQRPAVNVIPFDQALSYGELAFDADNIRAQLKALLASLETLAASGPLSENELADLFMRNDRNPMLESLSEAEAKRFVLSQMTAKGIVQPYASGSQPATYELSEKGRRIVSSFAG